MHVRKDKSELFEIVEHLTKFIRPEAFPELQPKDPKTAEASNWLEDIQKGSGKTVSMDDLNAGEDFGDVDIIERIK